MNETRKIVSFLVFALLILNTLGQITRSCPRNERWDGAKCACTQGLGRINNICQRCPPRTVAVDSVCQSSSGSTSGSSSTSSSGSGSSSSSSLFVPQRPSPVISPIRNPNCPQNQVMIDETCTCISGFVRINGLCQRQNNQGSFSSGSSSGSSLPQRLIPVTTVPNCGQNERRIGQSCECFPGFVRIDGVCQRQNNQGSFSSGSSSSVPQRLIPVTTVPNCGQNERRIGQSCECFPGFVRINGICQRQNNQGSSGSGSSSFVPQRPNIPGRINTPTQTTAIPNCGQNSRWNGRVCECIDGFVLVGANCMARCGQNQRWDGSICLCNPGFVQVGGFCQRQNNQQSISSGSSSSSFVPNRPIRPSLPNRQPNCSQNSIWTGRQCKCIDGFVQQNGICKLQQQSPFNPGQTSSTTQGQLPSCPQGWYADSITRQCRRAVDQGSSRPPQGGSQTSQKLQRAQSCISSKSCSRQDRSLKFKPSPSIRAQLKSYNQKIVQSKPRPPSFIDKLIQIFRVLKKQIGKELRLQRQFQSRARSSRRQRSSPNSPQFAQQITAKKSGSTQNTFNNQNMVFRLLQSQNNEHAQINEGNIQVDSQNCIFKRKIETDGSQSIIGIRTLSGQIDTITNLASYPGDSFFIQDLFATSNFLVIISNYFDGKKNYVILEKIEIDFGTCQFGGNFESYTKAGTYVGARQVSDRFIMVTQALNAQYEDQWYVVGSSGTSIVTANQIQQLMGFYPEYTRSVWYLNIGYTPLDYYFEDHYGADRTYYINMQEPTYNLHIITAIYFGGIDYHTIQSIDNAMAKPFTNWDMRYTYMESGFVPSNVAVDQYQGRLRVLTIQTGGGFPVVKFYEHPPQFTNLPSFDDTYCNFNNEYPTAILFDRQYVNIAFSTHIIIFDTNNPFQTTALTQSIQLIGLFHFEKFTSYVGLGYNNQGYPVAKIYNSYGPGLLQVSKDYVITSHPNFLPADSFYMVGHYKAFLINYSTNTLAFGFRNDFPSAPSQMKAGMLYLFAHSNGCITTLPGPPGTPGGGCLLPQVAPTPKYRVVYPHSGSTSSQDVTDGYTIMKQATGQVYIFSTSVNEVQVRKISPPQNPNLPVILNPPQRQPF